MSTNRGTGRTTKIIESMDLLTDDPVYFVVSTTAAIPYFRDLIKKIHGDKGNRVTILPSFNMSTNLRGVDSSNIYFDHTVFEDTHDMTGMDLTFLKFMVGPASISRILELPEDKEFRKAYRPVEEVKESLWTKILRKLQFWK